MLSFTPGYPLTSAVTVTNGPPCTWAQVALHVGIVCRTLDRVDRDIQGLEEWCTQH